MQAARPGQGLFAKLIAKLKCMDVILRVDMKQKREAIGGFSAEVKHDYLCYSDRPIWQHFLGCICRGDRLEVVGIQKAISTNNL